MIKKLLINFSILCLILFAAACGKSENTPNTEVIVFAAASMTETMDEIITLYKNAAPDVTVVPTYDSSGTLLTQIQEGADCDIFLSASPKQMNSLEESGSLLENTRRNLLENKVVLAVPEENPRDIKSFDQLAELLGAEGQILLATGNNDVPVGQYTQKIFSFYNLSVDDMNAQGKLTYGSNVKEVTTQISEAAVDCGIIYATDAFSAGLMIVDSATTEMCGQVIYPSAVLAGSRSADAAKAFLDFLSSSETKAVFERVGFTPLN